MKALRSLTHPFAVALVSTLLFTLLWLSPAHAQQCERWLAGVSHCDVNPDTCVSGGPAMTFGRWRYYHWKNLTDTPQKACENRYFYSEYKGYPVQAHMLAPDFYACWVDTNKNNVIDASEQVTHSTVETTNVQREPMCERTPNGPYKNIRGPLGVDGGTFSTTQRDAFKARNLQLFGTLRSDAGPARPPTAVSTEIDFLTWGNIYLWSHSDDMFIPLIGNAWSQPNVDHIIPRKDIHGCECGPNSNANALIVSWELNVGMSNNAEDARRQALLERWTLPPQ